LPEDNPDGTELVCRMPVVGLTNELLEQLNDSETQTINSTEGPGVAVYWSLDRTVRANIFGGLKFDGYTRYENLSSDYPDLRMQFSIPPILYCQSDEVDFVPGKDKIITIRVSRIISLTYCCFKRNAVSLYALRLSPGLLNREPASVGLKTGTSPLPGGR